MDMPEVNKTEEAEPVEEESYITDSLDDNSGQSPRMLVFEIDQKEQILPEPTEDSFEEVEEEQEQEQGVTGNSPSPVEFGFTGTSPASEVQESQQETAVQEPLEEQYKIQQDRREKLKILSEKLKIHVQKASLETDLYEIESVPAYKRRNVDLAEIPPSSQSQALKYSVPGSTENNSNPINENQYLHNKPD
jgi:cell division protein FtsZ